MTTLQDGGKETQGLDDPRKQSHVQPRSTPFQWSTCSRMESEHADARKEASAEQLSTGVLAPCAFPSSTLSNPGGWPLAAPC